MSDELPEAGMAGAHVLRHFEGSCVHKIQVLVGAGVVGTRAVMFSSRDGAEIDSIGCAIRAAEGVGSTSSETTGGIHGKELRRRPSRRSPRRKPRTSRVTRHEP